MHRCSKIDNFYGVGDIKYYWRVHCVKMGQRWLKPITYARFWDRLKRWWVLKKAIDTPNCRPNNICTSIYSKRNAVREITVQIISNVDTVPTLDDLIEMNRIKMPKPRKTWWQKLIEFFKRRA